MNLIFRPLSTWTDSETSPRKPGPFTASWTETVELLDRETAMLCNGGKYHVDVVLQVAAPERSMRRDGGIRADAKVTHPGVVVSFESSYGPMRYACDAFDSGYSKRLSDWQMNVRAIALGLEALRKVDRYGISKRGEQYQGWQALGSGAFVPEPSPMTLDDAARFIADHVFGVNGGTILADRKVREVCYRQAAKKLHPDAGGNVADFQRLQEAKRLLDEQS